MATLTIRNLNESIKQNLRMQSAKHGRSMEGEARAILTSALEQPEDQKGLATQIREIVKPIGGIELVTLDRNVDKSDSRTPIFEDR